jgi:iron complex outermembrane receptor protein
MCRRLAALVILALWSAHAAAQQSQPQAPLDELLNTRVSSAAKYEQLLSAIPASVTIITSEEIARHGFTTLAEALYLIRGTYTSYDRNYAYLGIRGFSRPTDYNNRFLVLLNGHSLNEGVFGSTAIGTELALDLDDVERIELIRGPGSVVYGTGAMFGVINIVTKSADQIGVAAASAATGSRGDRLGSLRVGHTFSNGSAVTVSGALRRVSGGDLYFPEFDQPDTNNGVAHDLDFDRAYGALLTAKHDGLKFTAMYGSRTKGIPTASYATNFNEYEATVDKHAIVDLSYEKTVRRGHALTARASWDRYQYDGTYPYETVAYDSAVAVKSAADLRWVWDARSNSRFIAGGEVTDHSRAQYRVWNAGALEVSLPFRIVSLYAQEEYSPAKWLSLTGGARYDHYSDRSGAVHDWLTPRLAVLITPFPDTVVKLLYGEAFRAPGPYEIAFEDPLGGAKRSENLLPETVRTTEISIDRRVSRDVFATVSLYEFTASRLIEQRIDPADGMIQYQNVGETSARGVEAEINYRNPQGVWSYVSYAHQNGVQGDEGLSNSPRNIVKAGVSTPTAGRLQFATAFAYESGRRSVLGAETDAFTLTDITLSYSISSRARLALIVRNAFDVSYASPAGFEHSQSEIPQDGRSVMLKLTVWSDQ